MSHYWPIANTSTTFYPGEMIGLNASGQATHYDDSTANLVFLGIFFGPEFVVDSTVPTLALYLRVILPKFFTMPASSATPSRVTDIGKVVYAVDSGHVQIGASGLLSQNPVGVIYDINVTIPTNLTCAAAGGWLINPVIPAQATIYRAPPSTTAATGTTQGGAAALSEGFNLVTGANGTAGVILQPSTKGMSIKIKNNVGSVLNVYPPVGSTINALASNTALAFASSAAAELYCYSTNAWYSIPLLPS